MVYGTGQEERKQNGESTCIGLECGAREMPVKEHVYELTSGCTYDVPKKLTYSTQGPSDEMVIRLNYHVHLHVLVARTQTLVNAWNASIIVNFGLISGFVWFCESTVLANIDHCYFLQLANSEHYYSPVYEGSTVLYAQLLERVNPITKN
jgi:hypothetical protein